jgi:ABC-type branched-subunit amino acid transport system permease subunit
VLHTFVAGYTEYWALLMGVLIIGIVLVLPTGVVSLRVPRSRHG